MRCLRLLLTMLIAIAITLLAAPLASAGTSHDTLPLHVGSAGPAALELKTLIHDPRPPENVFRQIKGTYHGSLTGPDAGYLGVDAGKAIVAYKWRLGYPAAYVKPIAGAYFFGLLHGTAHRPARWISIASARLLAVQAAQPTALALRIRQVELSQLNVREIWGNNRGPQVDAYSLYFHLGPGLAYCVIFQQWAFAHAGYRPPFADSTWAAYGLADWADARNLLHAKPKFGAVVIFVDYGRHADGSLYRIPGSGHVGFVVKVTATGYVSIEGNSGWGTDAGVHERFHGLHDRGNVFAYLRGVA